MLLKEINPKQYIPLVWKVVRSVKNMPSFYSHEDLFQIGFLGLMKAIGNYNEKKGPFIPYAKRIIKFAIKDEFRNISPLTRYEANKIKGDLQLVIKEREDEYKKECIKNKSVIFGDPFDICSLCDPKEQ